MANNGGSHHCISRSHRRKPFKVGEEVEPKAGGDWVSAKIVDFVAKEYVKLDNGKMMHVNEVRRVKY